VAAAISSLDTAKQSPSLLFESGLLCAYMSLAEAEGDWRERAIEYLNSAIERISLGGASQPSGLYGGLAGIGWTVEHVTHLLNDSDAGEAPSAEDGEDPLQELDQLILKRLEGGSWIGRYDLISGLVGVGVYWLERLPRPSAARGLELIVGHLEKLAEESRPGITWFTPPEVLVGWQREKCPRGYYNLGVAHGVPGIIQFLAQLAAAEIETSKVRRLLDQSVEWLLARERAPDMVSRYSSWFAPGEDGGDSRLGWCYGDLGIGATLLNAAHIAGEPEWAEPAKALLDRCMSFPRDKAGIDDAALCHGAAGVAHIYSRIYQSERDQRYRDTANRFFEVALGMRQPGTGVGGFLALAWKPGRDRYWDPDPSFLPGAIGIALALISSMKPVPPQWDRLLLLSTKGNLT
jgi:lantibiotic modifying enzyme